MQYFPPFSALLVVGVIITSFFCTNLANGQTKDTATGSPKPQTLPAAASSTSHPSPGPDLTTTILSDSSMAALKSADRIRQDRGQAHKQLIPSDTVKNPVAPAVAAPDSSVQPGADSILQNALMPVSIHEEPKKQHTPRGATLRSLVLPGWGQAYNHEYWKVPLAVAAVGIPIYLFIDNNKEYKSARFAYNTVFEEMPNVSGGKGKLDPVKFAKMDPKFQEAYNTYKGVGGNYVTNFLSTVQNYRNTFRQYRDYSIVAALLGWGLNIADATVFGHLRGFDVGPDLSMKIRPVYLQYARIPGVGLTISLR